MNSPEDMMRDIQQTLHDFEECNKIMSSIDITSLPFELQLQLFSEYTKFTSAVKSYNNTIKRIIIMASILDRT